MAKKQTWITPPNANSVQLRAGDIYERPVFEEENLGGTLVTIANQPHLFVANDPDIAGNPQYVYQLDTSITAKASRIDYTFLVDFPTTWGVNGEGGSGTTYIRRVSPLSEFIKGDPIEGSIGGYLRLDHTLLSEGSERWLVNTSPSTTGFYRIYNEIGDIILDKTGNIAFFDLPPLTIAMCVYLGNKLYVTTDLRMTRVLTAADTSDLTRNIDYIYNITSNVVQDIADLTFVPQGRSFSVLNASQNGSTATVTAATGTKLNGVTDGSLVIQPNRRYEFIADGTQGIYYDDVLGSGMGVSGENNLLEHAKEVILDQYGDTVSLSQNARDLIKFGKNPNVDTSARSTIWYTGQDDANETYVADNVNSINKISSSNASDTEEVSIVGFTMSGGNFTRVTQTATLNGQNKVTLGTALNRVERVAHNDQSSTDLVGEVYVYEDLDPPLSGGKPTNTTKIHITIPEGENQSQKCAFSTASNEYFIITAIGTAYEDKSGNTNTVDTRLETRAVGGVFKPLSNNLSVRSGTSEFIDFTPYKIIPPNTDVRMTALTSTNNELIAADIFCIIAEVV
jgi:hypothetical protein